MLPPGGRGVYETMLSRRKPNIASAHSAMTRTMTEADPMRTRSQPCAASAATSPATAAPATTSDTATGTASDAPSLVDSTLPGQVGTVGGMAHLPEDEIVYQSALQLWAAAQTDFDPYAVPPEEWRDPVPVTDADVAVDARLDLDEVRESLRRLDGRRLVVEDEDGTLAITRVISEDGAP